MSKIYVYLRLHTINGTLPHCKISVTSALTSSYDLKATIDKCLHVRKPSLFLPTGRIYRVFAELEGLGSVKDAELVTASCQVDQAVAKKGMGGDYKISGTTEWSLERDLSSAEDMSSFTIHVSVCVEVGDGNGVFVKEVERATKALGFGG
jgi:hypothetical protein